MDAAKTLPLELWSRILRIYVFELNTTDFNDWNKLPTPFSAPTLRKSAAGLSRVCSTWRDLILSDPQFTVLRIKLFRFDCSTNGRQGIGLSHLDVDETMLVALHKVPDSIADPPTVHDQVMRFAACLQALSIFTYNSDEVLAAFEALKEAPFHRLVFLEMGCPGAPYFDVSPTHLSQIRAPLITNLKFRNVNVFQNDTKDFRTFVTLLQGLNQLQHLDLRHFAHYNDLIRISEREPPDPLQTEVLLLETLTLADFAGHIVLLLRNLRLPSVKTLKLLVDDWSHAVPNEGWYSPGFDFPKLSLLHVSLLNLSIARLLSYSRLPELHQLIVGPARLVKSNYNDLLDASRTRLLPIRMPKLETLTFGLLSGGGGLPFLEFWSKCCTTSTSPTSICLNATEEVFGAAASELNPFRLHTSRFDNIRTLAIPIHANAMKFLNSGKLDIICAAFSRVENLQMFLHFKDDSRIKFLTPSAHRSNVTGYGQIEILPSLTSLSLFILVKGSPTSELKKCPHVDSFIKGRNSGGRRLARLTFNRPLAQKALVLYQKHVDQVVVEQKGWERVYGMTGQKDWPLGHI